MPSIDDVYKSHSDKIKAEDLGNQMYTLTVSRVEYVEFSDTDKKLVLSFHETDKTLPLNVTNARTIAGIYGNDYTMWSGQRITLFSIPVDFQGRTVLGIRIRAPQDMQAQPAPQQSIQAPLTNGNGAQNPFAAAPVNEANPPLAGTATTGALPDDEIPF